MEDQGNKNDKGIPTEVPEATPTEPGTGEKISVPDNNSIVAPDTQLFDENGNPVTTVPLDAQAIHPDASRREVLRAARQSVHEGLKGNKNKP